jgi:hypothetical protein
VRHTTPVLRAIQRVREFDNVAPATADLWNGGKTTERHAPDSAEHDRSLQTNCAALSITSVKNAGTHVQRTGAYITRSKPTPTACHGRSPVCATASSLASIRDSKLPSSLYKNNSKPKTGILIRNFFKSMGKTIKTNQASIADTDVIDEEACTHYTGHCAPNSWSKKTRCLNWIEGDAMRMRIELKFRLIRERMLAAEASNNRSLCG